jgi:hypothetical protein
MEQRHKSDATASIKEQDCLMAVLCQQVGACVFRPIKTTIKEVTNNGRFLYYTSQYTNMLKHLLFSRHVQIHLCS